MTDTTTSTEQPQQQTNIQSTQSTERSIVTKIETPEGQQRFPGIVKTFRKTHGFATVVGDNQYSGKDIMVNHANILTSKECYKTLKRGEHIEFAVQEEDDGRIQALYVTGPDGYSLQCETNPHLYQRRRGGYRGSHGSRGGYGGYRGRGRGRGRGYTGHGNHREHNKQTEAHTQPRDVTED